MAPAGGARVAALAALVAVAACSGSPPRRAAVPVRSSAQALAAVRGAAAAILAETASVSIRLDRATVFGGSPAAVTGSGAFDFRALRGAVILRPAGAAGAEPAVFAPGAVHVRPPVGTASLPAGSRTALANAGGTAGLPFALALQAQVTALGGAAAPPVRVWLAGDGRLVRMELSPPGAGVGTARTTLSGFGLRVNAAPPPAGQVVELTALSPAGERENRGGGDADGG